MTFTKGNFTRNTVLLMNRQSVKAIFHSLLIIILLAGCNQRKRGKAGENKPNSEQRVIVTNSDAFEMLIGLGAAENIVGISDMTMKLYIDKDLKWPSIGSWRNPNIEAITSLEPDVAVTYQRWPEPAGFDDKLEPFNISVERINCYYMSEFHSDVLRLASLVGKEDTGDTMIHDFDSITGLIKNLVSDIDVKKSVYIEFGDFNAMGIETGNNEMLELVNATNIAAKLGIQYPTVSTEWILQENPDIIIKIMNADTVTIEMYEKLVSRAGWNRLDAVKNKHVYLISNELCAGPRAMIGSLFIGKWCYPEKFVSIDPDSVHAYWMKKYYGISPEKFVYTLKM